MKAEPPRRITVVLDVGRTIKPLSPTDAEAYLRDVDTVFGPTCALADPPRSEPVSAWFAPAVAAEFRPDVLTPCWTMHRRVAR